MSFDRKKVRSFTTHEYIDDTRQNNYDGEALFFRVSNEKKRTWWFVEYLDTYHGTWYTVPVPNGFASATDAIDRLEEVVNSDFLRESEA